MKKRIKQALMLACLVGPLVLPSSAFAAEETAASKLKKIGGAAGYKTEGAGGEDVFDALAGNIVEAFLGLLGVIFLILIMLGGFNWMTAGGDEEKLNKAKKTINRSIVGLVILTGSYVIWQFISSALFGAGG